MKLSIDLDSREEIAAAVPLLQLILDNTPKACGGQCADDPSRYNVALHHDPRGPFVTVHRDGAVAWSGVVAQAATVAEISQDPAAVFGGAAAPAPLAPAGAPSIAGVVPLPIAPEATTATTSGATLSAPVPNVPTAPAMGAPTASGAAPSTPASGVELDSKGLPWDERIHAGTKTKLKSGEWKAKKQVEAALVAQVEAELRARVAASPAVPAVPAVDPAAVFGGAAPGVPPAPAIPTAPPVAPLAPAATVAPSVSADPTTFEQLMPRITAAVTAGIMPPTAVGAACAAHGVASVVTLQQSPQFVPLVWATLRQQYPALA